MFLKAAISALAVLASTSAIAQVRKDTFKAPNGVKLERTTDEFTGKMTYQARSRMWFDGYHAFDVRMAQARIIGRSPASPSVVLVYFEATHRGQPINLTALQFRGGESIPFRATVPDARCYSGFCHFSGASIAEIPEDTLRRYAVGNEVEAQLAGDVGRPFRGKLDLRELEALDALSS